MSGGRPVTVYIGSMASGASTLTSIDVTRSWGKIYADIQTMSTGAELAIYGSSDGTTFKPVYERVNTAPVQYQALTVGTATTGGIVELAQAGRYFQFRASAVVSGGVVIKLICRD